MRQRADSVDEALHDLQQPLNVIRLASGNIRARLVPQLLEEEANYLNEKLDRIDNQVLRAANQIEELRTLIPQSK